MSSHLEVTPNVPPKAVRHEDLVLQVYTCVLATLRGQTRMYQWLADEATVQQQKATQALAKSYRSIVPLIGHIAVAMLGFAAIGIILKAPAGAHDPAKPIELAQAIFKEGQGAFGNHAEAGRTEDRATSERAQMFYQKYNRDESSADNEWTRILQAIGEVARGELEAMRSMSR